MIEISYIATSNRTIIAQKTGTHSKFERLRSPAIRGV